MNQSVNRGFSKLPKLAIMPILIAGALLHENKNSSKNVTPVSIKPRSSDSKSNTLLSGLTWHLLVRMGL